MVLWRVLMGGEVCLVGRVIIVCNDGNLFKMRVLV